MQESNGSSKKKIQFYEDVKHDLIYRLSNNSNFADEIEKIKNRGTISSTILGVLGMSIYTYLITQFTFVMQG